MSEPLLYLYSKFCQLTTSRFIDKHTIIFEIERGDGYESYDTVYRF